MGSWKTLKEMEEVLTLEELQLLLKAKNKQEEKDRTFMAALQGVDLTKDQKDSDFERVKRKAAADMAGKTEEEYVFDMIGIEVETDDD